MALSSTTIQPVTQPVSEKPIGNDAAAASLLSMLVLSVYAAQKGKKSLRKLKRKFLWTAFKLKIKSMFAPKKAGSISNRTLIYILLGVVLLAILFIEPLLALGIAVLALILILAGVI